MENIPISVLLPFYNAHNTLDKAIQSIVEQTFVNWELILVNNASTDASVEIAKKWIGLDSRILCIDEPQKGIVHALNTGLKHCKGEFIARMDADDISLPARLEIQHKYLTNHPQTDLCSGIVIHPINDNAHKGYNYYVSWLNSIITYKEIKHAQFIESPMAHPSVMFRKSCVDKWGAYRNGDFPEDYELWLRWLSKGARMEKVVQELLIWNDHADRLSRVDPRYHPDAFFRIKCEYLISFLMKNNPFHPHIAVWGAGKMAKKQAELLKSLGLEIDFYIDVDPKKAQSNNCILHTDIASPGESFILSLSNNRGVGTKIREFLLSKHYMEGKDFLIAGGI